MICFFYVFGKLLLAICFVSPALRKRNAAMSGLSDPVVQRLVLEFFKCSTKYFQQIQQGEIKTFTWDNQKKFLDATVHSRILRKYPVNTKFSRLFFKKLIELLEPVQEVHDELYNILCSTMSNEEDEIFCYRHYIIDGNLNNIITIKETNNVVVNGTTGMRTWEAARMLADWTLSNKEILYNKKILELGCGVGFTGIAIAKMCNVDSVVLTDCHNDVLNAVCSNIEINFPCAQLLLKRWGNFYSSDTTSLGVMELDWDSITDFPKDIVPDILIGADIVYDPSIIWPLCNTMKKFCERNRHLKIFIANVIRNEETMDSFFKTLSSMRFTWESITHSERFIKWDQSIKICLLRIIFINEAY